MYVYWENIILILMGIVVGFVFGFFLYWFIIIIVEVD